MKIISLVLLIAFSVQEKTIFGEYHSFQCGKYVLKLQADSSFNLFFNHFDSDYKRTSFGKYSIIKDTLFLEEYNSTVINQKKSDSLTIAKETYVFLILPDNKLKNQSFYCGALSIRNQENWSIWEK